MSSTDRMVVVGASAAGCTGVRTLRSTGWSGEIVLVGDENCTPYDRPPLSKKLISGECETEKIQLTSLDDFKKLDVAYRPGVSAVSLDRDQKTIALSTGETLEYSRLLIATGARARPLPLLHGAKNCFYLRNLPDALAIRARLTAGKHIAIIGAGFIGTELAAIARSLGVNVTVIDQWGTPLAAKIGAVAGARIEALHESRGVKFHLRSNIVGVEKTADGIDRITLHDGASIECDMVIVAIGAIPNAEWLEGSGLDIRNGLVCDEYCAADNDVYAAGDVAQWFHGGYGSHMRIEHRTNASEQAMTAARNMLGAKIPYRPLPFFWSDQYDVQLQSYGRIGADFSVEYLSGSPRENSFVLGYFHQDKLNGVLSWNAIREGRQHLASLRTAWN